MITVEINNITAPREIRATPTVDSLLPVMRFGVVVVVVEVTDVPVMRCVLMLGTVVYSGTILMDSSIKLPAHLIPATSTVVERVLPYSRS